MKILHTSDWHLGKRLEGRSRLDEQREVLDEICSIADQEDVDAVLIAGDLFDTFNPPTEAVELFYSTVKRLSNNGKRPVTAIAGNHDSPERIEAPDSLARSCGIILLGYPSSQLAPFNLESGLGVIHSKPGFVAYKIPGFDYPLRILTTPYANAFRMRKYLGSEQEEEEMRQLLSASWNQHAEQYFGEPGVNVLMTHLFMVKRGQDLPEEPEEEKPINYVGGAQAVYTDLLPAGLQYVALGHLHRMQLMDQRPCPVMYSGSPLAYSFSEANQEKYVMLIELEPDQPARCQPLFLSRGKTLLRKRFESVEAAEIWLKGHPDCLVEFTLVSDHYLLAEDRKRLMAAHSGIINIIPEIRNPESLQAQGGQSIDLNLDMRALFQSYFSARTGQKANDRINDLFNEILSHDNQ